jgi:predicted nuclease of restriction endonuclease-like RecB superfamily
LIFTEDNAMVYRIAREFLLPAITHHTPVKERHDLLQRFRSGECPVVVTSRVLNEGVDVPEASQVVLTAHRNDPDEYKVLFLYLKLFGLMAYIEGDADHGFTLTVDGPASLFTPSPRYGLALAKLLPALLHVTRWQLTATLAPRQRSSSSRQDTRFTLEAGCGLVSHYPPGKPYDSILELAFAERWAKTPTAWRLEREVDLIPLPGSVMVPDFRLVHPDGRSFLLEIVGYWRPEYLRKKFAQVRRAGRQDLILAVSERLNLERAGVKRQDIPARVVWFKDRVLPQGVLDALEA